MGRSDQSQWQSQSKAAAQLSISLLMRTFMLIASLALLPLTQAADKIKDAIARGLVTKEFANSLTDDDVPAKWRTTIERKETDKYFMKLFSRGGHKILEVMWSKDWVGARTKMFAATVFDGKTQVAKLMRIGDRTSMATRKEAAGYELVTSVTDDGKVSLTVTNDKGYFQVIEVQGRESCLLEDLEYTKTALLMDQFVSPLLDAMEDQLDGETRKKRGK